MHSCMGVRDGSCDAIDVTWRGDDCLHKTKGHFSFLLRRERACRGRERENPRKHARRRWRWWWPAGALADAAAVSPATAPLLNAFVPGRRRRRLVAFSRTRTRPRPRRHGVRIRANATTRAPAAGTTTTWCSRASLHFHKRKGLGHASLELCKHG
jgi:hypothetical protein